IVIEKDGCYRNVAGHGPMAQVVGPDIDLRLFLSRWASGFALVEDGARGVKRSLQLFDGSGTAVHKVFLRDSSDVGAYERLVDDFTADRQERSENVAPIPAVSFKDDADVDVDGLRAGWKALRD